MGGWDAYSLLRGEPDGGLGCILPTYRGEQDGGLGCVLPAYRGEPDDA